MRGVDEYLGLGSDLFLGPFLLGGLAQIDNGSKWSSPQIPFRSQEVSWRPPNRRLPVL